MINPQNVFSPFIAGAGFNITVSAGALSLGGTLTLLPLTVVTLQPNATNFVFLNLSGPSIQSNTTGFASNSYTIAQAVTNNSGIQTLIDKRADVFVPNSTIPALSRLAYTLGTPLVGGNFALSGWGAGASITSVIGSDPAHSYTITAGTAPSIGPTIQLTFADGAWSVAPIVIAQNVGGTGQRSDIDVSVSTATYTLTYNGFPVSGQTYFFNVLAMGTL